MGSRHDGLRGCKLGDVLRRRVPIAAVLLAWGGGLLAGGATAEAEPVPIYVVMEGAGWPATKPPVAATLELTRLAVAGGKMPERREVAVSAPGEATVDLPAGSRWRVVVRSEQAWGVEREVSSPPEEGRLVMHLYPANRVEGRLELPAGEAAVASVRVRFRPATLDGKPADELPAGETTCPVAESTLRCVLPKGTLALQLDLGPRFATVYLVGQTIFEAAATDLGVLRMEHAVGVTGWVGLESGGSLPPGATVDAVPVWWYVSGNEAGRRRLREAMSRRASPAADGSFRLGGLAPGWWVLRAMAPGFAAAYDGPFEVKPESGPASFPGHRLLLQRPAELRLAITPPLDPRGLRWHVAIGSHDSYVAGDSWEGLADETGHWSQAGLAPRPYGLSVGVRVPGAQWLGEEIWTARTVAVAVGAPPQAIEIPIVEVEGRVLRGSEPVASPIDFWGPHGESNLLESGKDGRFRGALPEVDSWNVRVRPSFAGPELLLDKVAVRRLPGERIARLDFEIPATELTLELVGADGKPAHGGAARIFPVAGPPGHNGASAEADASGMAHIRGLEPGIYWVFAGKGSGWGRAEIKPGAASRLRLQLRPLVKLRGQVRSAQVPATGAVIHAVGNPALPGDQSGSVTLAVADAAGRFELELAPEARFGQLLVMAPGHGLRWLQVPLASPPELSIELPSRGDGTLVLKVPPAVFGPSYVLEGQDVWLGRAGGYVRIRELESWAGMQPEHQVRRADGSMVLPNVESGAYSLCAGAGAKAALFAGEPPPAAACVSGSLAAGGELVLDIASPPPANH